MDPRWWATASLCSVAYGLGPQREAETGDCALISVLPASCPWRLSWANTSISWPKERAPRRERATNVKRVTGFPFFFFLQRLFFSSLEWVFKHLPKCEKLEETDLFIYLFYLGTSELVWSNRDQAREERPKKMQRRAQPVLWMCGFHIYELRGPTVSIFPFKIDM